MNFTFLTEAAPGGRLHGMEIGEGDDLAVHLHGTWGNFYENPFVVALADTYAAAGWRYASVNLPSHDGGSIDETLDDSIEALRAWIDRLGRPGSRVILQGHSLGALKVIRALHDGALRGAPVTVAAAVLLAPFDIVAFNGGSTRLGVETNRAAVRDLVASETDALVPKTIFPHWPLSARTYLDITEPGGRWDVFPSRNGDKHSGWVAGCGVRTFVAVGGDDFAAFPDAAQVVDGLKDLPDVSSHVIPGAPHNFAGQEAELQDRLGGFLARLA